MPADGGLANDGGPPADAGPPDDAGIPADAGLPTDGGPLPTLSSWIGGECRNDDDCAVDQGRCLTGPAYPDGACSGPCTRLCPDRDGDPTTFCIDSPGALPGSTARCVSRCDYDRFPTGCRGGYACQLGARSEEPETRQSICLAPTRPSGQTTLPWISHPGGRQVKVALASAPYPHPSRADGYTTSGGFHYPVAGHYDDPSAYLIVPDGFIDQGALDLVVFFHGHNSSIADTVAAQDLRNQFFTTGRKSVLVVVQGPKNASDSGIGKLEDPGGFRNLVTEVTERLYDDGLIGKLHVGKIAVTAFSGGYRAAALSVDIGEIRPRIDECYLFDSFYGQYDRFFRFVSETAGRLVSVVTAHLASANSDFMARLDAAQIAYATDLAAGARLTFLRTDVAHGAVPLTWFREILESGSTSP